MSEKKTDIWMPLYIGEYVADTMTFTTEQHGAYMLLLMACWKAKGTLPTDDESLVSITKLPAARWRAMKVKVMAKFDLSADGLTMVQKRSSKEIAKAEKVSAARSSAGKAGAAKRWQGDSKPMANAMANESQTDGQQQQQSHLPTQVEPPHTSSEPGAVGGGEQSPTKAGEVCKAIRAKKVADVNPSSPELRALIDKGVPVETFEAAADICAKSKPPKGFAYLLGIVKRQLGEAAAIASGAGMPEKPWDENRSTIEAKAEELGLGRWNEHDLSVDRETFPQFTARVRRAVEQRQGVPA
ncbi:uncharacterized protein YdaU (DUF1376 family) [Variovorax sp. SG517]|uniref:YdaU family protein n=1 Tax=Variovorax sp. SG517 TaxID=2587117 RepID=UPI00159D4B8E|nr:DUF1376 domain-containing protein [Variovorax sp. SG517]NVM91105.1 uncharacterized protein YdaU (DUF1376 family) [Variovorax sp. SG517]